MIGLIVVGSAVSAVIALLVAERGRMKGTLGVYERHIQDVIDNLEIKAKAKLRAGIGEVLADALREIEAIGDKVVETEAGLRNDAEATAADAKSKARAAIQRAADELEALLA